jgi:hypothetical protein
MILKKTLQRSAFSKSIDHDKSQFFHNFKLELSSKVYDLLNGEVKYGIFKGMKIDSDATWNKSDLGGMLLGLYEQEILYELESNRYELLINFGAGDGYYAVGALYSKIAKRVFAFEQNEKSQEVIRRNASINSIDEGLSVLGEAHNRLYETLGLTSEELSKTIVLCDIEGAEFDLFTSPMFEYFALSKIIIEIHDFIPKGKEQALQLIVNSKATHTYREIRTSSRDLSTIKELSHLSDDERWLVCSEGRPTLMRWLVFEPKNL